MVFAVDSSSGGHSTPLLSQDRDLLHSLPLPQKGVESGIQGRKMKVITVATHKSGYFYALEESAERLGYELVLLGLGMKWRGFGWRTRMVIDYLQTLPADEIFLSVDAYDVILLRDSTVALEGFKKTGAKFLCGAFRKLDGIAGIIQEQEFGACKKVLEAPYNNICAGTWMSSASVAIALWNNPKYAIPDNGDDQRMLNTMFDDLGMTEITPDAKFTLFMTLFPSMLTRQFRDVDKLQITNRNTLISGVTNTEPILLHALCNANIEQLLSKLHFKNTKDLTPLDYHHKKAWYHIKTMVKHSWAAQLLIGSIILAVIVLVLFIPPPTRRVMIGWM